MATKGAGSDWRAAASSVVMRSGRHFARFTVVAGTYEQLFGVIRPGWDVEGGGELNAHIVDGHCFYWTYNGHRFPRNFPGPFPGINWEGMQPTNEQGDRIGMLLDLDQGSVTVWKNDVQLGMMQAEGLSGPLCWAIAMTGGGSARIESASLPDEPAALEVEEAASQ